MSVCRKSAKTEFRVCLVFADFTRARVVGANPSGDRGRENKIRLKCGFPSPFLPTGFPPHPLSPLPLNPHPPAFFGNASRVLVWLLKRTRRLRTQCSGIVGDPDLITHFGIGFLYRLTYPPLMAEDTCCYMPNLNDCPNDTDTK